MSTRHHLGMLRNNLTDTFGPSQLLEILLEVNDSTKIPPHLRYDLRDPVPSSSDVPELSPDREPADEGLGFEAAQSALEEVRLELQSKKMDLTIFKEFEASLSAIINRPKSLISLSKVSHSTLHGEKAVPHEQLPPDLTEDSPAGYLSSAHEEEFLSTLDAYLDNAKPDMPPLPPGPRPTDRERERDAQLHNPMSVFNWLSKHKHDVYTDKEEEKEKPAKADKARKSSPKATPQPSRGSKRDRKEAGSAVKAEPAEEILDDEGIPIVGEVKEKSGKRKRGGEDEAYRPKGGSSRPSNKRKRASTGVKADRKVDGEEEA